MYWVNNTNGYGWSRASIETQALLIEAFNEIAKDTQSVDAMKVWLSSRQNKQDWKRPKLQPKHVRGIVIKANNWLAETALKPKIYVGSQEVDIPKKCWGRYRLFQNKLEMGMIYKNEMGKSSHCSW